MYARLAALLTLPLLCFAAGDGPLDRATLRGVKAVAVVVDPLEQALERDGLSASELRGRIEDRLQSAGITINRDAREFLGLRLLSVRAKGMPVAVNVGLALYQPVLLARDNEVRTATETWEVGTVLMSPVKLLRDSMRASLDELVDQFIKAYKAANKEAAPAD